MTPDISFGVVFDHVQWGLPIGPFRLASRADIPDPIRRAGLRLVLHRKALGPGPKARPAGGLSIESRRTSRTHRHGRQADSQAPPSPAAHG